VDRRRKNNFSGLSQLQHEADRLLLELMGADRMLGQAQTAFRPNADVYLSKSEDAAIVKLELPGVDPQSVALEANGRALLVHGHRTDHGAGDKVYQQMEISYGAFERRLLLPVEVDPSRAQAYYEDGFLRIVLPLPARGGTRRIAIQITDECGAPDEDKAAPAKGDSSQ
jgi:HSP20 family protein